MQTFRSKLIASFIGSIVVFLLLSVSTQSAYEAVRNADFSEQETTIVRDCNHDDLSKLIFKKNSCTFDNTIDENSDSEILGGSTGKTEKTNGTARGKANPSKSPGFLESAKEKASSNFPVFFVVALLVTGCVICFVIKKRKRSIGKYTLEATDTIQNQSSLPFKNRTSKATQTNSTPPEESLRLMLFDFNQRLPRALKRRSHESLTDWTERIHLVTPLSPYFVTRYATQAEVEALDAQEIHHFEQDLAHYLKTKLSH
ncbi:hypothetical protein [Exiguobacterium sp. s168]|uniref:hypothetical protein n=1 Tax=Exiguobacterium sp. s168 TaxID=2751194 RepID=UPI001BE97F74|nr:hypothetical protein [Exiguobacterium sp. s168]